MLSYPELIKVINDFDISSLSAEELQELSTILKIKLGSVNFFKRVKQIYPNFPDFDDSMQENEE